jgi:hypothetical protein
MSFFLSSLSKGLIFGRIMMIEQEYRTSLDVWAPHLIRPQHVISPPYTPSSSPPIREGEEITSMSLDNEGDNSDDEDSHLASEKSLLDPVIDKFDGEGNQLRKSRSDIAFSKLDISELENTSLPLKPPRHSPRPSETAPKDVSSPFLESSHPLLRSHSILTFTSFHPPPPPPAAPAAAPRGPR